MCNALDVLLFRDGWSKCICRASDILSAFSVLYCDNTEKLLMFTEVGASMEKSGCVGIDFGPEHKSV